MQASAAASRLPSFRRPLGLAVTGLALLTLLAGCGKKAPEDVVLAQVGSRTITAADYRNELVRVKKTDLPRDDAGQPIDTATDAGKQEFLDHLIDRAVMVNKAEQLGIRNSTEVVGAEKKFTDYYQGLAMYDERIAKGANFVSNEELDDYYRKLQEARICKVMVLDFSNDADDARRRVLAGEDWAAVAKDLGAKPDTPVEDPYTTRIRYGYVDDVFEAAVWALSPGEISPVIHNQYGYWIVQLEKIEHEPAKPLDEIKGAALEGIRNQKINLAKHANAERLYKKFDYVVNETALWNVYQGLPENEPKRDPKTNKPIEATNLKPLDVPAQKMGDELFHFIDADGKVKSFTIADYKSTFDRMNSVQRPKHDQPLGMLRESLDNDVLVTLLKQDAKTDAYTHQAEVAWNVEHEVDDLLIDRLRQEAVHVDDYVGPAEIDSVYQLHRHDFVAPETRTGHVIFCKSAATAASAISDLKAGKGWAEVAKHYDTNEQSRKALGLVSDIEANSDDPVARALFALSNEGQIGEPTEAGDSWIVAQLASVTPAHELAYNDITEPIGAMIRDARRDRALAALVAKWRGEQNVVVHPEALADLPSWDEANRPQPATTAKS